MVISWPNVESLTRLWLEEKTSLNVFTETATNMAVYLPVCLVARVGGSEGQEIDKVFTVEVVVIAGKRGAVWDGVSQVEVAMRALKANGTDAWYVDEVVETFGFAMEPSDNESVRRATATYQLTIRPR